MRRRLFLSIPVLCFLGSGMMTQADSQILSKEAAVHLALEQNPDVLAARQVWEASQARIKQARALPEPELELEYEELSAVTLLGSFGERSFGATQTIEFPLKWWQRGQAASQAAKATRLAVLEMTRLDIGFRVKIAYDRVLFERKRLDYVMQNEQLAQDFLSKARRRLEAGDVSQLEVLRADVEAGRGANRVIQVRNELSVAKAELNTLLARPGRTPLEINGDLDYRPVEMELDKLQLLALERRPDFLGAGWALESSLSRKGIAGAALLPDLNVGVFRQTIRGPTGNDNFWRVGIKVDLPLWGAAQQRGELAEARALVNQALAEKNGIRNQILLEIESAFLEVQTSGKQVVLFQERILREAERSFVVANRRHVEGKANYVELLGARQVLIEVREEYAAALFNARSALYRLERASGGSLR